jgi:hypothetical protein
LKIALDFDISSGITDYRTPFESDYQDELIDIPDRIVAEWDSISLQWQKIQQEMFEWYEKVKPIKEHRMAMELEHFMETGEIGL